MPLMLTAMGSSVLSGQLVSRFGRYKWLTIVSMVISVVGGYLLFRLDVHSTNTNIVIAMLVLGLGMGTGMSLYTLIVQNALPNKIAQATASLTFFRQIGATIGLATMGSLMVSEFPSAFSSALPTVVTRALKPAVLSQFSDPNALMNPAKHGGLNLPQIPQAAQLARLIGDAMKQALAQSIHQVFVFCLIVIVAGLISVFFLKEIKLSDRKKDVVASTEAAEPTAEVVNMF
ncbi:MAG TPA: MFS transporter [Ktedonobacteraceae bacterium]